jgi:hypothetical protein
MIYHINTGLIIEEFSRDCECPVCRLARRVEEQFLHEYLNDAVMDDDSRSEVINTGFCFEHYKKLFARPNKLSLALQAHDRLKRVRAIIGIPTDLKTALKTAEGIKKSQETCIICKHKEGAMERYYIGIAKLFAENPSFKPLLEKSKGFCMTHYAFLLENAKHAGSKAKDYVNVLASVQDKALARISGELKWFCDKHDYRNRLAPLGTAVDVLPRTCEKLYSKKVDE